MTGPTPPVPLAAAFRAAALRGAARDSHRAVADPDGRALGRWEVARLGDAIADAVRTATRHVGSQTPARLDMAADAFGFRIVVCEMTAHGRLPDPFGPDLLVRAGLPATRMRFTIAHELAHACLARQPWLRPAGLLPRDEERACDAAAAAFLLPAAWVLAVLPSTPDAAAAQAAARRAQVSPAALIARANNLMLWQCTLADWHEDSGHYRTEFPATGRWHLRGWRLEKTASASARTHQAVHLMLQDDSGARRRAAGQIFDRGPGRFRTLISSIWPRP